MKPSASRTQIAQTTAKMARRIRRRAARLLRQLAAWRAELEAAKGTT